MQPGSRNFHGCRTSIQYGKLSLIRCTTFYLVCRFPHLQYHLTLCLSVGLVKTHFYHIWVQNKIFREKHELRVLHEMLADVCRILNALCPFTDVIYLVYASKKLRQASKRHWNAFRRFLDCRSVVTDVYGSWPNHCK